MIRTITYFIFVTFFLNGCFSQNISENNNENVRLNYYADKTTTSLEIPPDLTSPNYEKSFRLSEFSNDLNKNIINFSDKKEEEENKTVLATPSTIVVKKQGDRRWLLVDQKPEVVWSLSRDFFKSMGFTFKKSEKDIGILETNFAENKEIIPSGSVGIIRSMFQSSLDARYTLPTVDRYRLRIEPFDNGNKTEVFLTLSSMQEVLTDKGTKLENTIWQAKEKDLNLENEMLYRLMIYLGGSPTDARAKILEAKDDSIIEVSLSKSPNGFASLTFNQGFIETWDSIAWALDQISSNVDDKDLKEGAFYLKLVRSQDKGFMSRMFGEDALERNYQVLLKKSKENQTLVMFNDIEEENSPESKEYSFEFFKLIMKQFVKVKN